MKRNIFYPIAFILFTSAIQYSQNKFEGEIKYKVKYEGENITLNLFIQNSNVKLESKAAGGANEIFMLLNGLSVVLYPAQQIYVEYNDIKDDLKDNKPPIFGNLKDELKLKKTEVNESILGLNCEKWILKNPVTEVEMWVTREIKFNSGLLDAMPQYFVDWQEVLKKEKVLPMLVKIKDDLGNIIYSFEAYDANPGATEKNTFAIPANFIKQGKKK